MEQKQRREPRYPFTASAELLEENSGARMKSRISDLSLNGCYEAAEQTNQAHG